MKYSIIYYHLKQHDDKCDSVTGAGETTRSHKIISSITDAYAFRNRSYRVFCNIISFQSRFGCRTVILPDYVFGRRTLTTQIMLAMFLCTTRRRGGGVVLLKLLIFFLSVHICTTLSKCLAIRLNDFCDVFHTQTCIIYLLYYCVIILLLYVYYRTRAVFDY